MATAALIGLVAKGQGYRINALEASACCAGQWQRLCCAGKTKAPIVHPSHGRTPTAAPSVRPRPAVGPAALTSVWHRPTMAPVAHSRSHLQPPTILRGTAHRYTYYTPAARGREDDRADQDGSRAHSCSSCSSQQYACSGGGGAPPPPPPPPPTTAAAGNRLRAYAAGWPKSSAMGTSFCSNLARSLTTTAPRACSLAPTRTSRPALSFSACCVAPGAAKTRARTHNRGGT